MDASSSVSFKIFFSPEDVRRFRTEKRPTFEQFIAHLQKLYPLYHPEMRVQYVDTEGDKIEVTSEIEWNELFKEMGQELVKLYIAEPKNKKLFKDAGEPELSHFYSTPDKKPLELQEGLKVVQERVSKCLANLFHGSKILPHNLPSFLEGIVKVKTLPDDQVDLDVDIHALVNVLHQTALKCLDSADKMTLQKGRDLLMSLLIIQPDDSRTLYNLACAEALLGNTMVALARLQSAVEYGYANLEHMLQDADLNNIKSTETFHKIVQQIKEKLGARASSPAPAPVHVPVPEPIQAPAPVPVQVPAPIPVNVPSPAPAPVPIQAPVSVLPFTNHMNQLKTLHDMGFLQDEVIIPILNSTNGSVEQTISTLLNM